MSATFFPLYDRARKVSHVAIVFKDMTAEMVHREQLEEERELLSAIIDQVDEGIIMADQAGVFRVVNRAARELAFRPGSTRLDYDFRLPEGGKFTAETSSLQRALR